MQRLPLIFKRRPDRDDEKTELLISLRQAQKDYNVALSCFDQVTETDRVDEAIFLMQAAKKKYSYYLQKLRDHSHEDNQTV